MLLDGCTTGLLSVLVKQHLSVQVTGSTVESLQCLVKTSLDILLLTKVAPAGVMEFWVGKIYSGDMHVVGTSDGVFLTRSIRRNAIAFNLGRFAELENYPCESGLAALGNKLVHNKRLTHPLAFGVGAALPPNIDVEAIQVQQYAIDQMRIKSTKDRPGNMQQSPMSKVPHHLPSASMSLS